MLNESPCCTIASKTLAPRSLMCPNSSLTPTFLQVAPICTALKFSSFQPPPPTSGCRVSS